MNIIAEKYQSIREKWFKKTPNEKWKFVFNIVNYSLRLIGVNICTDTKIYWLSYTSYSVVVNYMILAAYTVYIYAVEDNILECITCFCVAGVMLAV